MSERVQFNHVLFIFKDGKKGFQEFVLSCINEDCLIRHYQDEYCFNFQYRPMRTKLSKSILVKMIYKMIYVDCATNYQRLSYVSLKLIVQVICKILNFDQEKHLYNSFCVYCNRMHHKKDSSKKNNITFGKDCVTTF